MQTAKPIEIDLRRDLPKVLRRRKDLARRLGQCTYRSPCAIGIMLPTATRKRFDALPEGAISILIRRGLVSAPPEQRRDLTLLQNAFDQGGYGRDVPKFERQVTRLEAKYLQPAKE